MNKKLLTAIICVPALLLIFIIIFSTCRDRQPEDVSTPGDTTTTQGDVQAGATIDAATGTTTTTTKPKGNNVDAADIFGPRTTYVTVTDNKGNAVTTYVPVTNPQGTTVTTYVPVTNPQGTTVTNNRGDTETTGVPVTTAVVVTTGVTVEATTTTEDATIPVPGSTTAPIGFDDTEGWTPLKPIG